MTDGWQAQKMTWNTSEKTELWTVDLFDGKRNGTFIEAGAGGESVCRYLRDNYEWHGVSIEPHPVLFERMTDGRTKVNACLYSHIGEVDYMECSGTDPIKRSNHGWEWDRAFLSGIPQTLQKTFRDEVMANGVLVKKPCITLEHVIETYELPSTIDLLQIDIEGAESEVLRTFPFDRFTFRAISIEKGNIYADILYANGYYMVENPYNDTGFYTEIQYIHESMVPHYKYRVLQRDEVEDPNDVPILSKLGVRYYKYT